MSERTTVGSITGELTLTIGGQQIPEAAMRAAADMLHADACPEDMQDCMCGDFEREAEVALEAALPHIRDALAVEVESLPDAPIPGYFATRPGGYISRDLAGRIVRGEQS